MAVTRFSLPVRIAATSMLVATVTSAVLVVGVQVLLAHTNDATARTRLDDRATAADATVKATPTGIRILKPRSTLLEQGTWIFDADGRLRSGQLSGTGDELSDAVRRLSTSPTRQLDTRLEDLDLLAQPVVRDGRRVATVVVSEDLAPYEGSELHSLYLTLALAALAVALTTVAAWMAASRSLRPVRAMAVTADEWREHDLGARFDLGPGEDEIAQLGRTLDMMLDRITEALSAERRLTDEIAHELRTPLAVVLAEADLARGDGSGDHDEALEAIRESALRMTSAIDTMLAAARRHSDSRRHSRLGELMTAVGQPATPYDDLELAAPTDLLAAALRPLLENAAKHGDGEPRVEVDPVGKTVTVAVVDDGPGVPEDRLETVFEPGHSGGGGGAGLGLSLARRMAHSAGAELVARPGPGGRFELRVPLH